MVGEDESGKTSLLRILAKLEKPSKGNVYIKDIPLKKLNYSKQKLKKLSNYQTHKRLIILKAYIPSASEYDNVWSKFRAYIFLLR